MSILVTGGAGYIGSHTCVELLDAGEDIVIVDDLSNSDIVVIDRIKQISNKELKFYQGDIKDNKLLDNIFLENKIESVIHFAAFKAVGESVETPLKYYENNIGGTIALLKSMKKANVKNIVFSSSATVYGEPEELPLTETARLQAVSPYGETKIVIEDMLRALQLSDNKWRVSLLRYFNPVGAHSSGIIGEDPTGIPNNLMPYITQVAIGKRSNLNVFGGDYPTPDGTCIRDYIHVVDLAKGHLSALNYIRKNDGIEAINLGTGNGYSVLEMVTTFAKVNNVSVPYEIIDRREGDAVSCYADASKAKDLLSWQTHKNIEDMCRDSWNWQTNNPNGYKVDK